MIDIFYSFSHVAVVVLMYNPDKETLYDFIQ